MPNSNVRLDREEAVAAARTRVEKAAPALVQQASAGGSRSTLILAAIAAGAQAFGSAPHHGVLVLLSDGLEEGPIVNLSKSGGAANAISSQLARVAQAGQLPDLTGVDIVVVGAGGTSTTYAAVERWWRAYAAMTHAKLRTYGRLPYRAHEQS